MRWSSLVATKFIRVVRRGVVVNRKSGILGNDDNNWRRGGDDFFADVFRITASLMRRRWWWWRYEGDEKEGTNGKLLFVLLGDVRRCCCLESQRRGNIIIGVWKDWTRGAGIIIIAATNRVVVVSNSKDGFMVIKKIKCAMESFWLLRESGKVREHASGTTMTMWQSSQFFMSRAADHGGWDEPC